MVRRVLWEHEIVGSSPATPTISLLPAVTPMDRSAALP